MAQALVMTPDTQAEIDALIVRARRDPVIFMKSFGLEHMTSVPLDARPPGYERPPSSHVLIPIGYRAAFSFEQQPIGLCRHLSVSHEGAMPSEAAVAEIARMFGFTAFPPTRGEIKTSFRIWIEEFDPGEWAVNIVELAN